MNIMTRPVLCFYWDLWSPKVQNTAFLHAMNWMSCCRDGAVTTFLGPNATDLDKKGDEQLRSVLLAGGFPIDDETPISMAMGYYSTTIDRLPTLPLGEERFPFDAKVFQKDVVQRVGETRLVRDNPRYPLLRDRTVPAPPSANPLTRPRPSRSTHNLFLPPWAYNA